MVNKKSVTMQHASRLAAIPHTTLYFHSLMIKMLLKHHNFLFSL